MLFKISSKITAIEKLEKVKLVCICSWAEHFYYIIDNLPNSASSQASQQFNNTKSHNITCVMSLVPISGTASNEANCSNKNIEMAENIQVLVFIALENIMIEQKKSYGQLSKTVFDIEQTI